MAGGVYKHEGTLELERGGRLVSPVIAYQKWGEPLSDGSNVVWVCHALTANADVFDWWPGLCGEGNLFDPKDRCIICANVLGSCYGTVGPLSENPETGRTYYGDFPEVTIRDMVEAHRLLASHLGIDRIGLIIGGSLGGQQALEWAVSEPDRFDRVIAAATNAVHSPWGVAFNETQRMAIEADATWGSLRPDAGIAGMRAARAAALLSYRHYDAYKGTQSPQAEDGDFHHRAVTYQRYQGEKLARRFNAYSYHLLSRAMDSHDLGRERGGVEKALTRVSAEVLAVGVTTDLLFPPEEQLRIATAVPNGVFRSIQSTYGHDGFLVETPKLAEVISEFVPHLQPASAKNLKT
jgi:homoserine O-acetyltransferase